MADLAASDITVTIVRQQILHKERRNFVKLVFGDGALTYPSGGVPLPSAGALGLRQALSHLVLADADDGVGIVWKYDYENQKLRGWQPPARTHAHDLKVIGSITHDETIGIETTGGPILGATTAQTVAKADSATKGGVLSETLGAGAMTEISGAIAAQTLYAEAVGY